MEFTLWLENHERWEIEAAVLGGIPGFSDQDNKAKWLDKPLLKVYRNGAHIREMLENGAVKERLGQRNAIEFIRIQKPSVGDFINWVVQGQVPVIPPPQKRMYSPV